MLGTHCGQVIHHYGQGHCLAHIKTSVARWLRILGLVSNTHLNLPGNQGHKGKSSKSRASYWPFSQGVGLKGSEALPQEWF